MTDVLVIGAGPAGLSAAAALAVTGVAVRVVDRDEEPGGVPRHSDHPGYGVRDLRRVLSGPTYARKLTDGAVRAGAQVDTRSTVTAVRPLTSGGAELDLTSPGGRETLTVPAVIMATGCRERPRAARLVPGARPAGILTTGWLQRLVHLDHESPGTRAVVVGAEHVSYSAVVTLADANCRTVAMITDEPSHTSFSAFDLAARTRYRFPLLTHTRITAIHGAERVTGVTIRHADGRQGRIACDTVVFTGDWYPENELAIRAGLPMDARTHGPSVDQLLRSRAPGIFAAGNLLHPASTADVCADDGLRAVRSVRDWLSTGDWPRQLVSIETAAPLLWSSPDMAVPGVGGPVRLQTSQALDRPVLAMRQSGRTLWRGRLPYIRPTRPFAIPGSGLENATADGPITISVD